MLAEAESLKEEVIRLRRQFHAEPELSFEEKQTAAFITSYLQNLGFQIRLGYPETAVVADLGEAPYLALRSDMDALPVQEQNISSYVSRKSGIMHACGHDAHMAVALAAASLLARKKGPNETGIRIIFEPGTESNIRSAGREMIQKGVLDSVAGILGFHVDSTLPAFELSIVKDVGIYSSSFSIELSQDADSGTKDDLITQGAQLVLKLKEKVSETGKKSQLNKVELTHLETYQYACQIKAKLFADDEQELLILQQCVDALCQQSHESIQIKLEHNYKQQKLELDLSPQFLQDTAAAIAKDGSIKTTRRRSWSQDFAHYAQHVPAAFFYLGTSCGIRTHHSSTFELDERPLVLAVALIAETLLKAAGSKVS